MRCGWHGGDCVAIHRRRPRRGEEIRLTKLTSHRAVHLDSQTRGMRVLPQRELRNYSAHAQGISEISLREESAGEETDEQWRILSSLSGLIRLGARYRVAGGARSSTWHTASSTERSGAVSSRSRRRRVTDGHRRQAGIELHARSRSLRCRSYSYCLLLQPPDCLATSSTVTHAPATVSRSTFSTPTWLNLSESVTTWRRQKSVNPNWHKYSIHKSISFPIVILWYLECLTWHSGIEASCVNVLSGYWNWILLIYCWFS